MVLTCPLVALCAYTQLLRDGVMEVIKGLCISSDANTIYQTAAALANFSCTPVRVALLFSCVPSLRTPLRVPLRAPLFLSC